MAIADRYTFPYLVSVLAGKAVGNPPKTLSARFLLTDSRQLTVPALSLFFALRTTKNDGHRYLADLLEKGVRLFVVERADPALARRYPEAGFICVESPLNALQKLAVLHRKQFHFPIIGITGSNGKTIVKEWLAQLLGVDCRIVRSPKSFNSQIGVPLSIWQMAEGHERGIFEAGISRPGEMRALQEMIRPDIGIFTNAGSAHDAGFDSRREKIREKMLLFGRVKTLICCADHTDVIQEIPQGPEVFGWGTSTKARLRLLAVEKGRSSTRVHSLFEGRELVVEIPFSDDASIENAMHCLCLLLLLGVSDEQIAQRMETLQPVAMRLELKQGLNNCIIINDSYNSDLNALAIALDFLNSHSLQGLTTLVLSDILQSGIPGGELYARVATMIAAKHIDRLIGIGPEISSWSHLFNSHARFFPDTQSFLEGFDVSGFKNEAILLKGARVFEFEKISTVLQQKDHQTILEVNLDALVHNVNVFRSMLKPGVKTMGMVKAFSYGSGSLEVARLLQYHRIDYLAVAYADEGKELRRGGISLPIVVMNPEVSSFELLLRYNLEPEISSPQLMQSLFANQKPGMRLPIHLKIDTGMHRLGFLPAQLPELIRMLKDQSMLDVASVFSHFAASGEPAHDGFSDEQLRIFLDVCNQLQTALGYPFIRHICNSAAVSRFPQAQLDMVRLGIGLYGISPDPQVQKMLRHVSTFKSIVSQVKRIEKGQTVGYSRAWVAPQDTEIAIIPIGYADGLNRRLGNGRGQLLVNGKRSAIVGNISMDSCALDVTGLGAKPGDEVIVFGPERPVTDFAGDLETIPYEVLTSVSQRVKRVYFQE